MSTGINERTWLEWLVKVRVIVITFLLAIELAIVTLTPTNVNRRVYVAVMLFWYAASFFHILLLNRSHSVALQFQSRIQTLTDLAFATAVIYVTGGIDTSFNFLYPLIIIVSSILVSQSWAYLTASLSFIMFGAILELSYFELIETYQTSHPDLKSLQAVIVINLFAYITLAYLAGRLSNRLRQADVELADKSDALEDLQALHENVVNSMSGGLITTDLQGRIKLVNPAGLALLERAPGELNRRLVQDLFLDPLPDVGAHLGRTEVRATCASGAEKLLGITASALGIPERGNIGWVYTFADLTEIRRLEREVRLRERLAAIGRLSAAIAHEIRNPLSSIAGSVKVLSGIATLTEDQRELVSIVTRESDRLNAIITDFLAYSREKKYTMVPVDIAMLLQDTSRLLENRPEVREGDVAGRVLIEKHFQVNEAITIGDGDKLKQVFWNVCENAIRALCAEQRAGVVPKLTIELHGERNHWCVRIADNGPGMAPQQLEKIFEPFQSAFSGGTGLGLAIVYQIVQVHGGTITVHSEKGEGAEFILRFRRAQQAEIEKHSAAAIGAK